MNIPNKSLPFLLQCCEIKISVNKIGKYGMLKYDFVDKNV